LMLSSSLSVIVGIIWLSLVLPGIVEL